MISDIPAQNIEAEKSLLGSLLMNNKYFNDCEYLVNDDFYKSANGIVFDSMLAIRGKGQKVDAESVWFEITKNKQESKIPGPDYLVDIMENYPLFNVKKYAEIIKDCSLTRSVKFRCMNILDSELTGEDVLSMAQSAMLEVQATRTRTI